MKWFIFYSELDTECLGQINDVCHGEEFMREQECTREVNKPINNNEDNNILCKLCLCITLVAKPD